MVGSSDDTCEILFDSTMIESISPVIKFAMMEWMEITPVLSSVPVCCCCAAASVREYKPVVPPQPIVLLGRLVEEDVIYSGFGVELLNLLFVWFLNIQCLD